jgi:hypothetical protein
MLKEIPLEEVKGKTISGLTSSCSCNQFVITFTDGTFTTLGINSGYEPGDETIEEEVWILNII